MSSTGENSGNAPGEEAARKTEEATAEPTPVVDPVRAELEETTKRLRDTEARLRLVSKGYQDLEQDMDAYRRRMTAQADQRAERKGAELVEKFFEPVQNLKRSLQAGTGDPASLVEGLKMVAHQFQSTLASLGLEEVPGVGAPFDPAIHEAIAVAPVTDKAQDGRVVVVHASGWRVGTKVLQPAQVVIGKLESPAEA